MQFYKKTRKKTMHEHVAQANAEWWHVPFPVTTLPGQWHLGHTFMDSRRSSGLRWYGRQHCVGRQRRGRFLWNMLRTCFWRNALLRFWQRAAWVSRTHVTVQILHRKGVEQRELCQLVLEFLK